MAMGMAGESCTGVKETVDAECPTPGRADPRYCQELQARHYARRTVEALRLRAHDLDFQRLQITVRHGKGGKDRRTMLPSRVAEKLKFHLEEV